MFPEELKNWYCDNWINYVYKNGNVFNAINHGCKNTSVEFTGERYKYINTKQLFITLAEKDIEIVDNLTRVAACSGNK
jgi:hypothetical protein